MNNNNQDAASFLSVPSDGLEQPFPSLSPQRSSSPNSIMSEQSNAQSLQQSNTSTSNLGSFRTRTRAGTLPSRFNSNTLAPPLQSATNQPPPSSSISPSFNAYDPTTLGLETLSISGSSPTINNGFVNSSNATAQATGRPRLRSGSLLGLSESNSIWSNDQPTSTQGLQGQTTSSLASVNFMSDANSPIREFPATTASSRLSVSPTKTQFQSQMLDDNSTRVDINRARAYSTNNVLVNEPPTSFYLQNFVTLEEEKLMQQPPPQQQQLHQQQHYGNDFTPRPRAQTFQNGVDSPLPIQYNFTPNRIVETPEYDDGQQLPHPPVQHSFLKDQPLLLDDIDPRCLNWTSTYQDPSLGPTNTLFLSNLPPQAVSPLSLANLLIKFGKLSSVRILKGNENAIVEFDTIDSAMQAKAQLNHQELMPGFACLIGFAKLLSSQQQQQPSLVINDEVQTIGGSQPQQQDFSQQQQFPPQIHVQHDESLYTPPVTISEEPLKLTEMLNEIFNAVKKLGVKSTSGTVESIVKNSLTYKGFDNDFGPLPEPLPVREYDAPKLRETRKLIDANSLSQFDIEELSVAMLDELPELASDYLGNTIVQKLFEYSSESIKYIMLKEVSPFLAQMGIHKNGTWSAQKMISVADTPIQKVAVAKSLKPYCVPLFNDQFGNYVIQCSLKFGSPWNDFIFEVILAKFWDIAQNRFGARAVRACLESHEASVEQTALISAAIILHAEHLAINQNAALLITWFLDTCTLPNRHILLAPRLVPHLAQLCTHKLASLTVLKILNHRGENEAKNMILGAIFGPVATSENGDVDSPRPPEILEQILHDNAHGATFIFKVISNPLLEPEVRQHVVSQVRRVLLELNVSSYQGYKRLMDEVGLSNRGDGNRHNRTLSNGGGSNGRKGRQNKTSPQGPYNNRRSTPNGYRTQPPPSLISPPQPPSFIQNQGYYDDQQSLINEFQTQQQFYQPYSAPQQQSQPHPMQSNMGSYFTGENLGSFDNSNPFPNNMRPQQPQQQGPIFDDPFMINQINSITKPAYENDRSIYQQQQPQYGFGTAQY